MKNYFLIFIFASICCLFTACSEDALEYSVGDTGPEGGIIFFADEDGFIDTSTGETCHFLEVARDDISDRWASSSTLANIFVSTSDDLGTGRANTDAILKVDPDAPAAKFCKGYGTSGDWFLPSSDELVFLFFEKDAVGSLTSSYWSSSQYPYSSLNYLARSIDFSVYTCTISNKDKYNASFKVRPIRAF
ncbi:MAG: hypothetical protein FWG49_08485 [Leptospirales bacterium]|nr:hypothetical protein [Leptospirales bacterium]